MGHALSFDVRKRVRWVNGFYKKHLSSLHLLEKFIFVFYA
ncbi:hypothetical protein HMPREF1991_02269 [Hoylesella loescheii DSM 19665 = JCM 12249 = ATCC 15930]|uniref:Uncharacterized protein n=1 Tax=Hoylesella loescheii DSM 19665 = JCM 12249 = ATCC 15930 TaxID=1122985 RepID=A0A069QI35_HOYLO|nr:hypothetical protein HMPREF1991_02269 [Hoylesella loescheii DSM 19665 = JCM 12249 = ATCC 15930]